MKLRDLFVSIGFDVDDKDLANLDKGLEKTKTLILAVGTAATAAAGLLYGMVKSVADTGDKVAKAAGRMGINIEMLQEYQYVADLAGVSTEELNGYMEQFIRRSAEAAKGSGEAKDAFKELGISVKDANGRIKGSDQLLGELADRFAAIKDGSAKVRLAYDLFGRGGIGMINVLNQGSAAMEAQRAEARELGIVLSEQTAAAAELFGDELLRAKLVIVGIKNQVGAQLLPVMTELLVRFREWVMLNRQAVRSGIDKLVRGAIALLRGLYTIVRAVVVVLGDMVQMLGGIERAAKIAAWAVGLFAGVQALSAIGNLAMGLVTLTRAIAVMGNAALIANLKLALWPVLIGAAIVALILWAEDLYRYFKGDKSVFGELVKWFETQLPAAIQGFIASLFPWFSLLASKFEPLTHVLDAVIEKIKSLRGLILLVPGLGNVMGAYYMSKALSDSGPESAPAGDAMYSAHKPVNVNVNAPVTVTVPEGTSPEQVGRAVQQGVADGLARMLRDAALITEPQVEH